MLKKLHIHFVLWKIYMQRSGGYMQIINFAGWFYAAFYQNLSFWAVPLAVLGGLLLQLLIGKLDYKFILEPEQDMLYKKVPQMNEVFTRLAKFLDREKI